MSWDIEPKYDRTAVASLSDDEYLELFDLQFYFVDALKLILKLKPEDKWGAMNTYFKWF